MDHEHDDRHGADAGAVTNPAAAVDKPEPGAESGERGVNGVSSLSGPSAEDDLSHVELSHVELSHVELSHVEHEGALSAFDDSLASLAWPVAFDPTRPLGDDASADASDDASDEASAAPDLAMAFLEALDAVDDARVVTPPSVEDGLVALEAEPPAFELAPALLPIEMAPELEAEPVAVTEAEPEPEPEPEVLEDLEEFVVFSLGEWRCVVPIRNVIEVGRIPEAAPVPNAPVWVHGLGNLRGQVLALIDLRAFLGVGRVKPSTGRMVVLRADGDEVTAGVMVDQVHQIVALSPSRFRGAPDALPDRSAPFVWGACEYGNYTMMGLDVDGVLGVESAPEDAA